MKLFLVRANASSFDPRRQPTYVVTYAADKDDAKDKATPFMNRLRGDRDSWDVLPLTEENARVHFSFSINQE